MNVKIATLHAIASSVHNNNQAAHATVTHAQVFKSTNPIRQVCSCESADRPYNFFAIYQLCKHYKQCFICNRQYISLDVCTKYICQWCPQYAQTYDKFHATRTFLYTQIEIYVVAVNFKRFDRDPYIKMSIIKSERRKSYEDEGVVLKIRQCKCHFRVECVNVRQK